jgi:uncharacterized protein
MIFEWNDAKRLANLRKHGVDFADAIEFDWENAITIPDRRFDYGEVRLMAISKFREHVHSIVYVQRERRRLVSFRRANKKEVLRYEEEKDQP